MVHPSILKGKGIFILYFLKFMSNKKINQLKSTEINTTANSSNINFIRKQLRNKLIKAGLHCSESNPSNLKSKSRQKRQNHQQKDYLPIISSLKNSLQIKYDHFKNQINSNLYDIFSHRDLGIVQQAFVGSKLCKSRQRDHSLDNFQENFRRRLLENIKLQKIQHRLPSLKKISKRQNSQTEVNINIEINSIKRIQESKSIIPSYISKQIIHSCSPRIKPSQRRSKTQQKPKINQQSINQLKINMIDHHPLPQYNSFTPWGEHNQLGYWKYKL